MYTSPLERTIMSFAISLHNDTETISNLEATMTLLKDELVATPTDDTHFVRRQELHNLITWYEQIHSALTNYAMFATEVLTDS